MSTIANLCVIWTQSENLPKIKNLGFFSANLNKQWAVIVKLLQVRNKPRVKNDSVLRERERGMSTAQKYPEIAEIAYYTIVLNYKNCIIHVFLN